MVMITSIRGTRPGTQEPPPPPAGLKACDRCGILREVGGRPGRGRNLCRACTCQLTPEQLKAWEL